MFEIETGGLGFPAGAARQRDFILQRLQIDYRLDLLPNAMTLAQVVLFCNFTRQRYRNPLALCWSLAGRPTVQRVSTVAFEGTEARAVDVQVQVAIWPAGVSNCVDN